MLTEKNCWQQDIRYEDYLKAFVKGIMLLGMTAYLFYDSWIAALVFIPALYIYLILWKARVCREKEQEFREQFRVSIQTMASA